MSDKISNVDAFDREYREWIKNISIMLMKKCCDFIGTLVMIFISDRVKIVMALTFLEN